jgi:hypothetical protein
MDRTQLQRPVILLLALLMLPLGGAAQMYQWRDAQGRLHFGDRPPENSESVDLSIQQRNAGRQSLITYSHTDFSLSDEAEIRFNEGLNLMVSIYTTQLGLDVRGDIHVDVSLLGSKGAFDRWVAERTGNLRSLPYTGIYLPLTREVAVWQWTDDEDDIVGLLLHESSHVILGQLARRVPAWLNEGMAQYFQGLFAEPDGIVIRPLPYAKNNLGRWVSSGELVSLRRYLNIPEQQWREMAHDLDAVPYTMAWGLVYFLMSSHTGRQTLRRLLHDLEKSGQWPTPDVIDGRYPGGLARLDYEFFRWAQGPIPTHRY